MNEQELYIAKVSGENIVLKGSAEKFINSQCIDDTVTVRNKQRFAQEVCDRILVFNKDYPGYNSFIDLINEIYEDIYYSDSDSLRIKEAL